MGSVAIVGDGPGGLSAALFLAKNGHRAVVYGDDKTAIHFALLNNYLGITEVPGPEFQADARAQVQALGAELIATRVTSIAATDEGFALELEDGSSEHFDYVILSEGRSPVLARALGLAEAPDGSIAVDGDFRSSLQGVYVIGRSVRPKRSQAIISAGAGATAALDILSELAGEDVQDWDSPPKEG
ncbi:MAG: FAD-dependent oxidoreductase [Acidobacteria bacterium]|nr:FAD-dependent oxidoreductase [Acidobacteriota bacterium]